MNIAAGRLRRLDPQQCRARARRARQARAGEMASRLHQLVERHGAGRLPGVAGLSAHRGQRRSQGLGQVRLRAHAGIPLGRPAGAAARGPQDSVRHPQGRGCLAGGAGRIPRHAAPPDRDPGRHRAGLGRAAAPSRQDRAVALRHAQPVPGQCRGGPPSLGDGLSAAEIFRHRRPRGGGSAAAAPLRRCRHAAHARRLQREDAGLAVVLHVHLSSPTATARCSSRRWRNPASIRCRAPAASC